LKLAIVTTHPVQYNAPLFELLASQLGISVKVFYTLGKGYIALEDKAFRKAIIWDIPLLNGYDHVFLENTSSNPSTSHFKGVVNPTIIDAIEAFKPNAIFVYGWSFASHLKVLIYFKNKVPIYFRGDSTLLDEQKNVKVIFRRLFLKWVYKHIDKAVYVGTNNKQYFLKHGVSPENLIFAPHAIDNYRFGNVLQDENEIESIRRELGIPEQNIVFLFSGKFENKKSPLLLIQAFKALKQERISLLLVGSGVLEGLMKEEAGSCSNIHFLPFQNQTRMPGIYRSADVFVLPSGGPGETWGLSVNEAMACGLVVITSDKVGCAVDLIQENVNGYIFEVGNPEKLMEKLSLCAAKNKAELKSMGEASKGIIKDWNFGKVCAAIVANLPAATKAV
jgi:glycosyltransferase involved in cell wall biosynthesis